MNAFLQIISGYVDNFFFVIISTSPIILMVCVLGLALKHFFVYSEGSQARILIDMLLVFNLGDLRHTRISLSCHRRMSGDRENIAGSL